MQGLRKILIAAAAVAAVVSIPARAFADDFTVYSVYRALDLGNPGETPQKDFYVNMGASQGLQKGTMLDVYRKIATYDLNTQKLYKDITLPVGRLKVIHVEPLAAIARLESLLPPDQAPVASPRAVMIGDIVKLAR